MNLLMPSMLRTLLFGCGLMTASKEKSILSLNFMDPCLNHY
jgi:hypothetical protein